MTLSVDSVRFDQIAGDPSSEGEAQYNVTDHLLKARNATTAVGPEPFLAYYLEDNGLVSYTGPGSWRGMSLTPAAGKYLIFASLDLDVNGTATPGDNCKPMQFNVDGLVMKWPLGSEVSIYNNQVRQHAQADIHSSFALTAVWTFNGSELFEVAASGGAQFATISSSNRTLALIRIG